MFIDFIQNNLELWKHAQSECLFLNYAILLLILIQCINAWSSVPVNSTASIWSSDCPLSFKVVSSVAFYEPRVTRENPWQTQKNGREGGDFVN